MSWASAAAAMGRRAAEAQMDSTCTVTRPGPPVTDPASGEVTATGTVVYSGRCRVRPAGTQGGTATAGGALILDVDYIISVPASVTGIREDDRLTVDSSPDPALAGVVVQVRQVAAGDHITARRLSCRRTVEGAP